MNRFDRALAQRLQQLRAEGLYRELRQIDSSQSPRIQWQGRLVTNFSSNDYLGLSDHPRLKEAAVRAVEKFGAGSGASRLICGSLACHHEMEEGLAHFKGSEAALSFSSGYSAAVGTITALLERGDTIIIDKKVHASIVDAARLSGANLRVFRHNDVEDLARILKWATTPGPRVNSNSRSLVITESVFSMDGDLAPLREIVELKEKFGAWLMVDEAHATGLFGEHRRGVIEAFGLEGRVEIQMGTLGKAVGAAGGYICGSRTLVDWLINRARSFIFSTAPVPASSAAALAGIQLIQSSEGESRRQKVWSLVDRLKNLLLSWRVPVVRSPIIPLILGPEATAVETARELIERGCFVPAIRYPTVARGQARLRITLSAGHEVAEVEALGVMLEEIRIRGLNPQHA